MHYCSPNFAVNLVSVIIQAEAVVDHTFRYIISAKPCIACSTRIVLSHTQEVTIDKVHRLSYY